MEQVLPRLPHAGLNGSPLFALLAEWGLVERSSPKPSFVAGLGHWLGWKESIELSAALQAPPGAGSSRVHAGSPSSAARNALEQAFSRVRQELGRAMADETATVREDGGRFVLFRQHYVNLQHTMASAISPLRAQARAALQPLSLPMARLAALDAAMAEALGAREQSLLAQIPVLLEKHFMRLQQSQHQPGWLAVFRGDMQRLLAAELDLRLQTAQGLLDTLQAVQLEPDLVL